MRLLPLAALAALLLALPSPGLAKAPPKGKYDCVIGSSSILFGTLAIKADNKYSHRDTKGSFKHGAKKKRFSDGRTGWTIKFKGGDLGGISGRWYKTGSAAPLPSHEIALRNPEDDFESIYCDKRR